MTDATRTDRVLDCAAVRTTLPTLDAVLGVGRVTAHLRPVRRMRVVKSGWMTGITEGRVRSVTGDLVTIERLADVPEDYQLSDSGDSGAVWLEVPTLAPVGWRGGLGVCSPAVRVLRASRWRLSDQLFGAHLRLLP